MSRRHRTSILAALVLLGLTLGAGPARAGGDHSDPAYLQHDLDNMSRSLTEGRQLAYLTDLGYGAAFVPAAAETFLTNLGRQVTDLPNGRLYATLGEVLPGGSIGNPLSYPSQHPVTVSFLSRTGAKLTGRLWSDGKPGPHPGVVITPGSIQGTQHMYFWAADALARSGYQVLTFDAQGQGESETFGHAPGDPIPTGDGFPFQQEPNFVDGTVDALRYLFSSATDAYVPGGWTAAQVVAAKAAGDPSLSWANPAAARLDRTRVALAGHSLGARAISVVQQCSDAAELWRRLPVCTGRSWPIKAVVAWDGLSASDDVTPVVPAMDQQADGYFLNPAPAGPAPAPDSNLAGLRRWRAAGLDAYALTVRGGTHLEWVDVPYILPSTTYGVEMAERYTVAWIDRYLSPSLAVREDASARLAESPRIARGVTAQLPWTASFMSARQLGGFTFHDARGGTRVSNDLRRYGGVSRVGDWAGANADRPKVRSTG